MIQLNFITAKRPNKASFIFSSGGERMYLLIFAVGWVVGYATRLIIKHKKPSGNLLVDSTDPDGPFIFLEATDSLTNIIKQKEVMLTVKHRK